MAGGDAGHRVRAMPPAASTLPAGCSGGRLGRGAAGCYRMVSAHAQPGRGYVLWAMDYYLGKIFSVIVST